MRRKYHLRQTQPVTYSTKSQRVKIQKPTVIHQTSQHDHNHLQQNGSPLKCFELRGRKTANRHKEIANNVKQFSSQVHQKHKKATIKRTCSLPPSLPVKNQVVSFICGDCGKSFTSSSKLDQHKKFHSGENAFICNSCGEAFKTPHTLKSHRLIHTGDKPFQCDTCGRCFRRREYLVEHRFIHTGEKPFVCEICEKTFRQRAYYRRHRYTHSILELSVSRLRGKTSATKEHKNTLINQKSTLRSESSSTLPGRLEIESSVESQNPGIKQERTCWTTQLNVRLTVFPFKCTRCQRSFNHHSHLEKHVKFHKQTVSFNFSHSVIV